ncbi:MAG: ABC transporter ATP-binding protein [Anaerolineae bacterium]|nr:ABC transporter ATP-binding protein [Anaerolineae bacterium]
MATLAVETKGLAKVYGLLTAVDHISFDVRAGEVFALLGPNGAGKTTTIRMLTGLTRPTSGQARVLGLDLSRDLPRIKKQVGVVPERSNLYDELTARDNLLFIAALYGVPRRERGARADELLRRFRLEEKRDAPFARLSRGMKRALTVAAALIHRPRLIFLDEPTVGLDVVSARGLRALIERLREEGVTIFLTTHYMEEAERLADRVALLVQGGVVALDTVENLKARVQRGATVEAHLAGAMGEERLRFHGESVEAALHIALAHAEAEGKRMVALNTLQPTLEDAFIQLTGLSAEVMLAEKGGR